MDKSLLADETRAWLIDLDDTLYEQSSGLMEIIDQRIDYYFSYKLRCNLKEAGMLREKLFARYQNTFVGALNEKIILQKELYEFMKFAHNFDFSNIIVPNFELLSVLRLIKGKKYIFSNAIKFHIDNVLNALKATHLFNGVYDIASFSYKFKPDSYPFHLFMKQNALEHTNIIFVDDTEENLDAARRIGLCSFHPKEIVLNL
jgi:putative hydrolase of the HAD superfamily